MRRLAAVLLILSCVLVTYFALVPSVRAGGVVGDGSLASCTEAALDAVLVGGGAVTFSCGGQATITLLTPKSISQPTSIDGNGVITLAAGAAHDKRLFDVLAGGSLELRNITLYKGTSFNGGGGAVRNLGPLTVSNVMFQNSLTSVHYCGGALQILGDAVIEDSTFSGNVGGMGGAICVRGEPGTQVRINRSTFVSNQAPVNPHGMGGALYVDYGTVLVEDSSFVANSARLGGAIYTNLATATVTLEGSPTVAPLPSPLQLNGNNATWDGGAIYNLGGTMTIHNALLSVNKTPTQTNFIGYGGGIYSTGVLTLTGSTLLRNEGRFGGGLYVGSGPADARAWIEGTVFRRNVSGGRGGGMYASGANTTPVTVLDSAFTENEAVQGGGLARFNMAFNIYDSSLTANTAQVGGGMHLGAGPLPTDGPYVRVQSVTLSGNTATTNQGGGVYNYGRVALYSTTIVTNTNGVFSVLNGNTRFRSTVLHNPATLNCDGDGTATISDDLANFSTDNSCALPNSQTGIGLEPLLGPLQADTRGPTSYHMPLAGSPLINAGVNCPPLDQIGAARPDACDIGAVEYGGLFMSSLYLPVVAR